MAAGTSSVRTICPYCGVGCGIVLRVEAGRVARLEGDAGNPVNRGALCPKGATAHEFVHHADRLTTPLVRKDGTLHPATWDEALDLVAREFTRILSTHGGKAFGLVSSARATVEDNYMAQKFGRAVLQTNNVDNCFRICHSATVTGLGQSFGSGAMTNPIADFLDPGPAVLLMVGSNAPHAHPIIWTQWMKPALDRGAKLVVIDPRVTDAAKRADVHLQARPGTEVLLFHAMAHHILENGWQDDAFIAARTEGIDALREAVAKHTPESVAETVGVSADDIKRAARMYATLKPASIAYGLGVTEHRNGVDNVRALANLALLTGNVGKPSTGVNALRGQNNVQGATDMIRPESLPGYQKWSDAEAVARFEDAWGVRLPVPDEREFLFCSRMWEAALAGEVKALYLIGTDPALTEGNLEKVRRGIEAAEFVVAQDVFPSSTTQLADVVLPACSYAEKEGTFVNSERRVQRVRQAIAPVGDSRPDSWVLIEIAKRMGHPIGPESPSAIFDEIARLVPSYAGLSHARLDAVGHGIPWPCPTPDSMGVARLHETTFPIGRARFAAPDPMAPDEAPDADYPLLLTTGRTFMQYNCGTMTRRTRMERGEHETFVEINERDATRLGVTDGARVRVATRRGAIEARAKIAGIAQGVVWMPFHFAEQPANALTNDAVDPECGITELKACAARIEPA